MKSEKRFLFLTAFILGLLFLLPLGFCELDGSSTVGADNSLSNSLYNNGQLHPSAFVDGLNSKVDYNVWYAPLFDLFTNGDRSKQLTYLEYATSVLAFLIIVFGVYDMISLVSIFRPWISVIIGISAGLIAAFTGIVLKAVSIILTAISFLGTVGVIFELLIGLGIWFGLVLGSSTLSRWAIKRKGQADILRSVKNAQTAKAGFKALKELGQEARRTT